MNVIYDSDDVVKIAHNPFDSGKIRKQEIADYLMGKSEGESVIYNSSINERMLLMSYLPLIHTIAIRQRYLSEDPLEEYQIELVFGITTPVRKSKVILEVSKEMYKFLAEKK